MIPAPSPQIRTVNGRRVVTREYSAWQQLKNRCLNRKALDYGRVQVKGARLDPRWYSFANFIADMGPKPSPDSSIRQRDTTVGFFPENCFWGPPKRSGKIRAGAYSTYDIPPEFSKWISRCR